MGTPIVLLFVVTISVLVHVPNNDLLIQLSFGRNTDLHDFFIKEHHVAGLAVFLAASFGMAANSMVVFWISHFPSMQNAFGKLSMNQCVADLLHGLVFALYFAPTVFFDIVWLKDPQVSRWFGHLQLIFYDACNASHLMVSINRVCAIFFPIQYHTYFTVSVTRWLNFCVWFSAIVPSYFAYIRADCILYYNETFTWTYAFKETHDCMISGWYYDFMKSLITISIIITLDTCTFIKCRVYGNKIVYKFRTVLKKMRDEEVVKRRTEKISGEQMLRSVRDAAARTRRKDEIHFVTQACLQGLIFTLELITFFLISTFFTDRRALFVCTTMAWVLVHAFDGVIAIVFNKEFCRRFRKYRTGATVYSNNTLTRETLQKTATTEQRSLGPNISLNNGS